MRRLAVSMVGLIYIAAWFLPVIENMEDLREPGPPGWIAMRMALSPLWSGSDFHGGLLHGNLFVLSGLTNFVFVVALVRLLQSRMVATNRLSWILLASTGVNTYWVVASGRPAELYAGYYLWLGSFALLAVIARVRTTSQRAQQPHLAT